MNPEKHLILQQTYDFWKSCFQKLWGTAFPKHLDRLEHYAYRSRIKRYWEPIRNKIIYKIRTYKYRKELLYVINCRNIFTFPLNFEKLHFNEFLDLLFEIGVTPEFKITYTLYFEANINTTELWKIVFLNRYFPYGDPSGYNYLSHRLDLQLLKKRILYFSQYLPEVDNRNLLYYLVQLRKFEIVTLLLQYNYPLEYKAPFLYRNHNLLTVICRTKYDADKNLELDYDLSVQFLQCIVEADRNFIPLITNGDYSDIKFSAVWETYNKRKNLRYRGLNKKCGKDVASIILGYIL